MKWILWLFFVAIQLNVLGQVRLPKLISDGMVLQRNVPVKVWGWASANEAITLLFRQRPYKTIADFSGNWMITLPPQPAGGPYNMTISGKNSIQVNDIVIGDVWICSGQSNMELTMERVRDKYAREIAQVNNPFIRHFTVPDKYDFNAPQHDLPGGKWEHATTGNIFRFSAVAYFFAKELFAQYKVPIGLINASLGGSPAEAWLAEDALKKFPAYYKELQEFKDASLIERIENSDRLTNTSWHALLDKLDEGLRQEWWKPSFNDAGWQRMQLPGYWIEAGLNMNGAVWFRKEVDIPATMTGKPGLLWMGRIADADSIWINGVFAGTTSYQYPPRRYELKPGILQPGKNIIAVRVISNAGKGGFVPDKPYQIIVDNQIVDLKGYWKYKPGAVMEPLPAQTFIRWKPTGLFNAMIAPLLNYAIKGAIWYQGESNTKNPSEYQALMETLIADWRSKWKRGNFPFLFVQVANFMEATSHPTESNWAELRQAQLNTLTTPATGMAVAIDLGEWNDIHPLNKQEVGRRLALQAMRVAYGDKKIVASGPLFRSMQVQGSKIILNFAHTGSGLVAKGNTGLQQFSIAGPDKKFIWANAIIKDNRVIVWHDSILHPHGVRYAWAHNPAAANLYNKEGLPASPFEAYIK
ncbi:MAG TPA: sialate O-acetylesterase [Chitinophagaceae bacterium]|nr:sialate O-acetylesterase [Chitinophagaceae bacterium]